MIKEVEALRRYITARGFVFFQREGVLNLWGIRTVPGAANRFDDAFVAFWHDQGVLQARLWPGTTDPGRYYLLNPIEGTTGTGALVEGRQYINCWQIGLHQGRYEAWVQRGTVDLYRDSNRDDKLDLVPSTIEHGMFAVNVHRAETEKSTVDRASAACQVLAHHSDFDELMMLSRRSAKECGGWLSYGLTTTELLRPYNT